MAMAPGWSESMSCCDVSAFIAMRTSMSFLRATYPFLLARMVYQVGSPAMFDGKRFLPLTGTPMAKMLRSKMLLADCEPEPLTVAIWMLKSLITGLGEAGSPGAAWSPERSCAGAGADGAPALVVAMWRSSLQFKNRKTVRSFYLFIIATDAAEVPHSSTPRESLQARQFQGARHKKKGAAEAA